MATYIGFNTQNLYQKRPQQGVGLGDGTGNLVVGYYQSKKFRTTDTELVIQDISNALGIRQGSLPGNPSYGTTIWSYVFEPSTPDVILEAENEIRRVISQDPRVILNTVSTTFSNNGLLIQLEISVAPFNQAITTNFFLNKTNGTVSQV